MPLDALLEPVCRKAEPEEDLDGLVPKRREPDEPVELDPVFTSMAPPSNDSLEPLRIRTWPPFPADELPTRTDTEPETPLRVLPDANVTSPEFFRVEGPDEIETEPLLPLEPPGDELNVRTPLLPERLPPLKSSSAPPESSPPEKPPAINILPPDPDELFPDDNVMEPPASPCEPLEMPAKTLIDPPVAPEPTMRFKSPDELAEEDPVLISMLPLALVALEPVVRDAEPDDDDDF